MVERNRNMRIGRGVHGKEGVLEATRGRIREEGEEKYVVGGGWRVEGVCDRLHLTSTHYPAEPYIGTAVGDIELVAARGNWAGREGWLDQQCSL